MHSPSSSDRLTLSDGVVRKFQDYIAEHFGLSLTQTQNDVLVAAVGERMVVTGTPSAEQYLRQLLAGCDELAEQQALFVLLATTDTTFFRGLSQFSGFRRVVIPELVRRAEARDRTLRVWSAGCSSGEETYALAICLLETLPDPESWTITVVGTDLHQKALEAARRGSYHARSVRSMPAAYLDKYFQKESGRYVVTRRVRELAKFSAHNLVRDRYHEAGLRDFDVIVCRNVLIYLKSQVATQVAEQLYESLVPEGYLWLGHAETLWQVTERFGMVQRPDACFYQRPAGTGRRRPASPACPFVPLPTVALRSRPARIPSTPTPYAQGRPEPDLSQAAFQRGLDAYGRCAYQEALELFEQLTRDQPYVLRGYYMRGLILASLGRYDEAVATLRELLERDQMHAEGYYLLGVVYQKAGQPDQAVEAFQGAVDADATMALAHYQLGELYRLREAFQAACTAYAHTLKALEKNAADALVPYSDELTGGLLAHSCQRRIEELCDG
jgi:chemotaxis protein methyltransferase CheR